MLLEVGIGIRDRDSKQRCGSARRNRSGCSDPHDAPDPAIPNRIRTPTAEPRSRVPDPVLPTYLYDADTPRLLTTPGHYAYVKIAEGCDYTCAFCIIPTLRGEYRSRTADSIVREAESLAARGVRELLLISQDTTFFGIDRGERGALAALLRRLNAIDGLAWIRLLYLYPTTITDDVLEAMADCEKVCRYVDLPLQHASADVLKRMRRPGNRRVYDELLARIRDRVPGVTLRTTLIVGFPGETEQDFAELDGFVADTGFDHVGVFTYSHEEGTRAHALTDDVPAAVKRRAAQRADGAAEADRRGAAGRPGRQRGRACWSMARRGARAGAAGPASRVRRPTSTRWSTSPTATRRPISAGDLVAGADCRGRGYDLVAAPIA